MTEELLAGTLAALDLTKLVRSSDCQCLTGIGPLATIRFCPKAAEMAMVKQLSKHKQESVGVQSLQDEFFMEFALAEAKAAHLAEEVPIGAVVIFEGQIVGRGHNQPRELHDPTAHAEINALREAAQRLGNYRLTDATLYVTIEPCAMCAGAIVNARINRLVYGAEDARAGAVASVFQICTNSSLNHRVEVTSGILAERSRELMQVFFKARRKPKIE